MVRKKTMERMKKMPDGEIANTTPSNTHGLPECKGCKHNPAQLACLMTPAIHA